MHPAYYTPLAPHPTSVYLNPRIDLMQNRYGQLGKGENAARQYWAKARVVGRKAMHHGINCIIVSFRFERFWFEELRLTNCSQRYNK